MLRLRPLAAPLLRIGALLPLLACGGDSGTSPGKGAPAATVRLSYEGATAAAAGATLDSPVILTATDADGRPLAGRSVSWFVSRQGSRVVGAARTDADGRATAQWAVDTIVGVDTLRARVDAGPTATLGVVIVPGAPVAGTLAQRSVTFVSLGDAVTVQMSATDRYGNAVPADAFTWTSSDATVAPVTRYADGSMHVTAAHQGTAHVRAELGAIVDSMEVVVAQVVARVSIAGPRHVMLAAGDTLSLRFVARDIGGSVAPLPLLWQSSAPSVLTVNAAGTMTAHEAGTTVVRASLDQGSDTMTVIVAPTGETLVADTVARGYGPHACALVSGVAYCWGFNALGQVGHWVFEANGDPAPAPVLGTTRFASIGTGSLFTCALTPAGEAWCWGSNVHGELGRTGGSVCNQAGELCDIFPTPVATTLTFRSLAVGANHACGLADDGHAYCWGENRYGQLGAGPIDLEPHTVPTLAAGGRLFASLAAGEDFTCGLSADGAAYCWGSDDQRQLGSVAGAVACQSPSTLVYRCTSSPVLVPGVPAFASLVAGKNHACGLTASGAAWCWGNDNYGQLGDGLRTFNNGNAPTAVLGGLSFSSLGAGVGTTCGVTTTDGRAYCWGAHFNGALGTGESDISTTATRPQPVYGDRRYRFVLGGGTSCGLTTDHELYCWGDGSFGTLGTGAKGMSTIPIRVRRP